MTNSIKTIIIALISITSITTTASAESLLSKLEALKNHKFDYVKDYAHEYAVECKGRGWLSKDIYKIVFTTEADLNSNITRVVASLKNSNDFETHTTYTTSNSDGIFLFYENSNTLVADTDAGWHIEIVDDKWSESKGEYDEVVVSAYCKEIDYNFINY